MALPLTPDDAGRAWQLRALLARSRHITGIEAEMLAMLRMAHRRVAQEILATGLSRNADARLRGIYASLGVHLNEAYLLAKGRTLPRLDALATVEGRAAALLTSGLGDTVTAPLVAETALFSQTVAEIAVGSSTFGEWWTDGAAKALERVKREIQYGLVQGQSPTEIARRIYTDRDPKTGKTGGAAWKGSRAAARMMVRTVATSVQARAALAAMRAAGITRCRFEAILDGRTSIICAGFDGTEWDLDDPKLPIPALHPNCRSALVPIVAFTTASGREIRTGGTRESYAQWFARQDDATQNSILGPARAKLVRDGKATLADLVATDRRPLTLKQLEARLAPDPAPVPARKGPARKAPMRPAKPRRPKTPRSPIRLTPMPPDWVAQMKMGLDDLIPPTWYTPDRRPDVVRAIADVYGEDPADATRLLAEWRERVLKAAKDPGIIAREGWSDGLVDLADAAPTPPAATVADDLATLAAPDPVPSPAVMDDLARAIADADALDVADAAYVRPAAFDDLFDVDGELFASRPWVREHPRRVAAYRAATTSADWRKIDQLDHALAAEYTETLRAYVATNPPPPSIWLTRDKREVLTFGSWLDAHPTWKLAIEDNLRSSKLDDLREVLRADYERRTALALLRQGGGQLPSVRGTYDDIRGFEEWADQHPDVLLAKARGAPLGDRARSAFRAVYDGLLAAERLRVEGLPDPSVLYRGAVMDYADYAYRHPRLEFYRAIKDLAAERAEHQRLRQVYDTLRDEALLAATEQRRLLSEQYGVAQWIDDAHRGVDTTAIPANARGERAIGAGRSEWRNQLVYQKDTLFPADHDIWRDPDMIAALANDDKDLRFAVLRRYLDRAVADLADTMHTWIRASDDVLEEILRGGEFKNQYFTGSSKGMNNPMARLDAENALFGYDYPKTSNFKKYGSRYGQSLAETGAIDEAHLRQRPIYGYITDDPMGGWGPHDSVRQYGNVRVRLKSQVRPRTTVTGDDSLGFAGGAQSGEWDKWTVRELRPDTMRLLARPLNALDSRFLNPNDLTGSVAVLRDTLWREARYLEAQYHGGLRVADIAEVVFPADGGDYHELQRMLMRLGIPFRTVH